MVSLADIIIIIISCSSFLDGSFLTLLSHILASGTLLLANSKELIFKIYTAITYDQLCCGTNESIWLFHIFFNIRIHTYLHNQDIF